MKRIISLDQFRGLMALLIMFYHFSSWTFFNFDSNNLMERFGRYGVSIFYILSGMTLYFVYNNKISEKKEIIVFYIKRIFRILPLLWVSILLTIFMSNNIHFNFSRIISNLFCLYGFYDTSLAISGGSWSIGNEMFFYLFFPLIIFLLFRSKFFIIFILCALASIYIGFAFYIIPNNVSSWWNLYINSWNQFLLFYLGILLAFYHNKWIKLNKKIIRVLFLISLLLFIYIPIAKDPINLVINNGRVIFTILSLLLCFTFFKSEFVFPRFIDNFLRKLGEGCYSLYLLHPLVYNFFNIIIWKFWDVNSFTLNLNVIKVINLVLAIPFTYLLSQLSYKYFESYFVKLGNRFAKKI